MKSRKSYYKCHYRVQVASTQKLQYICSPVFHNSDQQICMDMTFKYSNRTHRTFKKMRIQLTAQAVFMFPCYLQLPAFKTFFIFQRNNYFFIIEMFILVAL
jgi:hypothetical protein